LLNIHNAQTANKLFALVSGDIKAKINDVYLQGVFSLISSSQKWPIKLRMDILLHPKIYINLGSQNETPKI